MANAAIPALAAIAAPLAATDLLSVRRGGQTRNEKAQMTDLAAALGAAGPAPLAGYGTVTSVGLTTPSWLAVAGSPIVGAGTLALGPAASQAGGQVLATPASGSGTVTPRTLGAQHLAGAGATSALLGAVKLAGDLAGTASAAAAPIVGGWQGQPLDPTTMGAPASGNVPTWSGSAWVAQAPAAGGGLSNPLGAGSLGAASLQLVAAGDGLYQPASHVVGIQAGGLDVMRLASVASAVNYLAATAAATGNPPQLAAAGSDTNIALLLVPKGTGVVGFFGAGSGYAGLKPRSGFPYQMQVSDGAGSSRQPLWVGGVGVGGTVDNFSANDAWVTQTGGNEANFRARSTGGFGWTVGADASQSPDTQLTRPAAGVVSIDDGTYGDAAGQIKAACTTGSGTVLGLGANCPAATLTAPATWLKVTTQAGAQGYVPVYV
jgi:hypothetical protein